MPKQKLDNDSDRETQTPAKKTRKIDSQASTYKDEEGAAINTDKWHNIPQCLVDAVNKLQGAILDTNMKLKLTRNLITHQEQKVVLGEKRQQEYVTDQLNI